MLLFVKTSSPTLDVGELQFGNARVIQVGEPGFLKVTGAERVHVLETKVEPDTLVTSWYGSGTVTHTLDLLDSGVRERADLYVLDARIFSGQEHLIVKLVNNFGLDALVVFPEETIPWDESVFTELDVQHV